MSNGTPGATPPAPEKKKPWYLPGKTEAWYEKGLVYADRSLEWVEAQDPASRKGATIGWYRRYRQADGQLYAVLLTAYIFITLLPAALVISTYMDSDPSALADRLTHRLKLSSGSATTKLLHDVLTGAGQNKLGATLIAVADVAIFGLGIGRVLQLAHARSWRIDLGKARLVDQTRYFAAMILPLVFIFLYLLQAKTLAGHASWIGWLLIPVWAVVILGYFVWMPRMLLRNRVTVRQVLPGAVFTLLALAGMRLASQLLLHNWLEWYAKYYGGLGIIMAFFFWIMIAATILVIAAALSPALSERRELMESQSAGAPPAPTPSA